MNQKAADRKIKKLLSHCASMINIWIPVNKRIQYLSFFNSLIMLNMEEEE
tara:strand:- start:168 stop:317 length:150 start_codon:yes stop_codon:yes gene_type:complete